MTVRWSYPRRTDEFAWPSVPYDQRREPVRLRIVLCELRSTLLPKRP